MNKNWGRPQSFNLGWDFKGRRHFLAAEDAGGQREQGFDEAEKGFYRYADKSQRKHQKPYDGEKDQSQDRHRPAYDEQQQP